MDMIFLRPVKDAQVLDVDTFTLESERRWAPYVTVYPPTESEQDATASIEPPEDSAFQVWLPESRRFVSTDGTPVQALEVGLWLRELLPAGEVLWMATEDYSGHVELRSGMSEADVDANWVKHDDQFTDPLGEGDM